MRTILSICILIIYSIGLGISIVPAVIGLAGFWFGFFAAVGVWLFVVLSAHFYGEAVLANPDGANLTTISRNLLGTTGAVIGASIFLYAHYSILTAYFLYGSNLYYDLSLLLFGFHFPAPYFHIPLVLLVGLLVFLGIRWCGWMAALGILGFLAALSFIAIRAGGLHEAPEANNQWLYLLLSIPILYNTLFIQSVVPPLASFLKRDWKRIKTVIWIGTFIGLAITIAWLWICVNATPMELRVLEYQNYDAIYGGNRFISLIPGIGNTVYVLSLIAYLTTLPIAALVMVAFLSDLFNIPLSERKEWKRLGICLLALLPPFALSQIPRLTFEVLINYTLGLAILVISAVFPLLWIFSARYIRDRHYPHRLRFGGGLIMIYALAALFLLFVEGVQLIKL